MLDGLVRDVTRIKEMKLPIFCTGRRPLDSCGRGIVTGFDLPVLVDDVSVRPGDLVVGDADGVVIVPREIEEAVLARAWAKVAGENTTRDELRKGALLAEVYEKYGIL